MFYLIIVKSLHGTSHLIPIYSTIVVIICFCSTNIMYSTLIVTDYYEN